MAEDYKVLYPGAVVPVVLQEAAGPRTIEVSVRPLGFKQMGRFGDAINKIAPRIHKSGLDLGDLQTKGIPILMATIVPLVLEDLLPLIAECCSGLDLTTCPHWLLPPIIEAWLNESFGSADRIRPWVEVVDNTLERLTGKPVGMWEILSNSLSPQATASTTSSTTGVSDKSNTSSNGP